MKKPSEIGMKTFGQACAYGLSEFVGSIETVHYGAWCLFQVLIMPVLWPLAYLCAMYNHRDNNHELK